MLSLAATADSVWNIRSGSCWYVFPLRTKCSQWVFKCSVRVFMKALLQPVNKWTDPRREIDTWIRISELKTAAEHSGRLRTGVKRTPQPFTFCRWAHSLAKLCPLSHMVQFATTPAHTVRCIMWATWCVQGMTRVCVWDRERCSVKLHLWFLLLLILYGYERILLGGPGNRITANLDREFIRLAFHKDCMWLAHISNTKTIWLNKHNLITNWQRRRGVNWKGKHTGSNNNRQEV